MKDEAENQIEAVMSQVAVFLENSDAHPLYKRWIDTKSMRIYLRKTPRLLSGLLVRCLDVANIEVDKSFQESGLFTAFMLKTHEINPYEATYLEYASNPIVEQWCIRHAWVLAPRTTPPSFYLFTDASREERRPVEPTGESSTKMGKGPDRASSQILTLLDI